MKKLIALLLLVCNAAQAELLEDWSETDKRLFIASQAALMIDWKQTREIASNPSQYGERNKILGEHPSMARVNTYFASALVANYLIADYLTNYRTEYLSGIVLFEVSVIGHNKNLGLKIGF
jgi:hypothetical protein